MEPRGMSAAEAVVMRRRRIRSKGGGSRRGSVI